jgi:hypothetical protein
MTIELILNVFWLPEDLIELQELDEKIVVNEGDCVLKEYTFYTIEAVYSTSEHHCMVISGGLEYQVNEKAEVVKSLIREQLTYRWN